MKCIDLLISYLYVICAIHHNCPVLLIVHVWSRLPQLFGLVPLPLSCLYIWKHKHKAGVRLLKADKQTGVSLPEAQTSTDMSVFLEEGKLLDQQSTSCCCELHSGHNDKQIYTHTIIQTQ